MILKALLLVGCIGVSASKLPRGVPHSRSAFYARAKEFQCLDGSARIPYEQVNDDYCDCADGSDEPGTSACPNGRFYCENKLHTPEMLLSSRVNDHLCDCCDGSDEYDGTISCPNTCEELGRSARVERERRAATQKAGWEKRKELAQQGLKMKQEKEAGVADLRAERALLEPELATLEATKKAAEEKEKTVRDEHSATYAEQRKEKKRTVAGTLFASIDTDKDGKITLTELSSLSYLDLNGDGRVEETEVKIYTSEDGVADLEHFIEHSFFPIRQKMRDQVDAERRAKEDEARKEEEEREKNGEAPKEEAKEGEGVEKHADDEEVDVEEEPSGPVDEFDDDVPYPPYTEEQNKVFAEANDARSKFDEVNKKVQEVDDKIREAESFSSLDFGEDLAWAPIKGKCVELEEGQYTYKLCPFDRTAQKEKGGYSETNLGEWKGWEKAHRVMKFADGTTCWNGPARSTKVTVECGDEDQLVEASEPGRCEYHFVMRSPAVCEDPEKEQPLHVEL